MCLEESVVLEELEVLKSIYPEIQYNNEIAHLQAELQLEKPLKFVLESNSGKVIQECETKHLEGFSIEFKIPVTRSLISIKSSWIDQEILDKVTERIRQMIDDNLRDGLEDSLPYTICDYATNDVCVDFKDDIYQNHLITTNDKEQYERYLSMISKARLWHFQRSRFTCSICLDVKEGSSNDGILLDCDHAFCQDCFRKYVDQIIDSDDVTKLQCPNCPITMFKDLHLKTQPELKQILFTRKISNDILLKIISLEKLQKYEFLLTNLMFAKYEQYYPFSCSKCPRCSTWLFRDDVDDKLMRCHHCSLAYCFDCNHSWHGTTNLCLSKINTIPIPILEFMLNEEEEEENEQQREKYRIMYGRHTMKLAIDGYLADKLFRQIVEQDDDLINCPKCDTVITKSDGCNKMKCLVCNANFCYLCGKSLHGSNPYEHYNDLLSHCYGRLFEGMPGVEERT